MLGVETFGQYGFALAVFAFFTVISDFGIENYQTRQTAIFNDKNKARILAADSFISRLILSALSAIIIFVISVIINKPLPLKIFLWLLSFTMILNCLAGSFISILLGYEKFKYFSMLSLSTQMAGTMLGILVLYLGYSLPGIGVTHLITAVLSAVAIAITARRVVGGFSLRGKLTKALDIIKQSAPLGITAILITIYYRADLIMLSIIKGDQAVGCYNSAYALVNGLLLVSATFSSTLLPRMSSYFKREPDKLDVLYQTGFKYLLFFGMAAAFGAAFLAEPIYRLIYPEAYLPGANALKILIWAMAMMFVNTLQNALMIARDLKKRLMYLTGAGAFVNIILNLILIPPYGFAGAALATVASELITAAGFIITLRSSLPYRMFASLLWRLLPALALMVLSIKFTESVMIIPRILIGAAVLVVALVITGGLNRRDFRTLMGLLSWGKD
ncbi:MAG: flippase [candidate division Zixibacteria bacterium]|nr:flippase [candidate division Zixibacteria bacterium]